jgi:hypothetical protein
MALFKRNKDKGKRLADGSGDERPVDKPKRKRPASTYPVPLLHLIPCLYISLIEFVADTCMLIRNRLTVDTAFKQQRLKAWQPILTPKSVLPTLFAIGLLFAPIGAVLIWGSNTVSSMAISFFLSGFTLTRLISSWSS